MQIGRDAVPRCLPIAQGFWLADGRPAEPGGHARRWRQRCVAPEPGGRKQDAKPQRREIQAREAVLDGEGPQLGCAHKLAHGSQLRCGAGLGGERHHVWVEARHRAVAEPEVLVELAGGTVGAADGVAPAGVVGGCLSGCDHRDPLRVSHHSTNRRAYGCASGVKGKSRPGGHTAGFVRVGMGDGR